MTEDVLSMPSVYCGDSNGIANWKGFSRGNEAEYHKDMDCYQMKR